jgi:16S rRNA A1518/A1519 N6-dimethyltransferase RsmA/KsgA/DIM1 with predicted DNA glycosylase/AP lyase activity
VPGRTRRGHPRRGVARPPDLGQHFLASRAIARSLVDDAGIGADDVVVEPGAGRGVLTRALAARARHVLAIELDAALARATARAVGELGNATLVQGDATTFPLPQTRFRVVANPAFNTTAALLHHLLDLDPCPHGLVRADLVVQWQVARLRVAPPRDLLGITWAPWWTFRRGRRLPAALFRPAPAVDAAVLVVERRERPSLASDRFDDYAAFVRAGFTGSDDAPVQDWVARFRTRYG